MLSAAVDGSFRENAFDESVPSSLEAKLARFLNGSASSTRNLEREREVVQTLISDISHQTRTPIANILLYASLLAEVDLPPEQAEQAAVLAQQGEKLSFLIQTLVKASRLETGIFAMDPQVHGVQRLLDAVLIQGRQKARERGLSLTAEPTSAQARFDEKWTAEALYNLVDNALKYTPAGRQGRPLRPGVRAVLRHSGRGQWPRHPEGEQGAIFGRFYRGEAVRDQEGLGIGPLSG